jgi:hypothetical protein
MTSCTSPHVTLLVNPMRDDLFPCLFFEKYYKKYFYASVKKHTTSYCSAERTQHVSSVDVPGGMRYPDA